MTDSPKRFWMSLVDRSTPLTVDPERAGRVERHSPGESAAVHGDPDFITTRRSFLKAAGFTFAGAVATSCGGGRAVGALPYVAQPEGLVPGRPVLYASTCAACEAGCGVLVTNRDGRPVKIEGNPDHPFSGGSTCAVGQASILGLYDSMRLAYPTKAGQRATWADVDMEIATALAQIKQDRRAVIHDPAPARISHPRRELISRLRKRWCELCEHGATVAVHQVAALSQLGTTGPGQPAWAALMAKMRRKTLIVCAACHDHIHANPVTNTA